MKNTPNLYDRFIKDMVTSRTFKAIFGTLSVTVLIAVCLFACACLALIAAAVYRVSGFL